MTKSQRLYNAKQKMEAVLRYAEIALKEVNELLELPDYNDENDEDDFLQDKPDLL